jgi:pimeloyl-ACP methyl ester carboxylesterase
MARQMIAFVAALGLQQVDLVGFSIGGFVAQEIALAHSDRVRKLVLCSTSPGGPNAFPMPERGVDAFSRFPTLEREAGLRLMVENSLGDHAVRERPQLVDEVYAYRLERAPSVAAWQAQLGASRGHDAYERIAAISAPTLVIHALADTVIDARNGELLAERIPGARIERVPDRGHLVMWQEGERLMPIVRDFLRG